MNASPLPLLAVAAALLAAPAASGQSPVKPPPWWGVNDEVTLSLYWSFDAPFTGWPAPTAAVVPTWYVPTVTNGVATPNVTRISSLAGHVGVLGMQGTGAPQTGALDLTVDNDPHTDWIKMFWFQFDVFEGTSGSVVAQIERSLAYERAVITEKAEVIPLGQGWQRVTIAAQLIPQPDDEGIDWAFAESAFGTVAIDNLFVSSKCVKPGPDETGDALGDVDAATVTDLTTVTGGQDCQGVAVTEGPAPAFTRRYWVGTRATGPGQSHAVLRIDGAGPTAVVGTTIVLGVTPGASPRGVGDLAAESVFAGGALVQQWVYAIVDQRAAGLAPTLFRIDAQGVQPTAQQPLFGFPAPAVVPLGQDLGLAFDPSGDLGAGTFWVSGTDSNGNGFAVEYSRGGAPRGTEAAPPECRGLGYDAALGNFYGFSADQRPSPAGPVQVNGFEWSGYDFQPTGTRFCGDLTLPFGSAPRGGVAAGLEVWRSRANPTARAPLRLACVAESAPGTPGAQVWLYELAGPFGFGHSVLGRCGMRDTGPFGGVPFLGSTMEVTLTGVPRTLFAALFLGFSNTTSSVGPLPLALSGPLGWPESVLSISPDVNTGLLLPSAPGEFSFQVPIPAAAALGYAPVFFQWLALDTGINGFFAMSQAGKTVLYP